MAIRFLLFVLTICSPPLMAEQLVTPKSPAQPLTNQAITGRYYYSHEKSIKDVYITTPINGKFYFRFFMGQTPSYGKMVVQYYNEIDGVATFDQEGVAHYQSPYRNCELRFLFRSIHLLVDQRGDCGMSAELGMEARGTYNQLEAF